MLRDPDGSARVVLRRTSFPRLLDVAFSQIRHYGKADVAVPLRMMRVLGELAAASRHAPHSAAILDQARRLAAACDRGFPDDDRADLDERLGAVERSAAASMASGPDPARERRADACRPFPTIQGRAMSLTDYLFGRRLATDEEGEQRVGVWAGIPMLGLDALGSAAYGPEAALTLLIPLGAAGRRLHRADHHADHRPARWSSTSPTARRSRPTRTAAGRTPWPRRTSARPPACSPPRP